MPYFVYMILTERKGKKISYVGYTNDLKQRIIKHNNSKGAKFTKGKIWKLIHYNKYENKNLAMKEEYKLKKNYYLRNKIKINYLNEKRHLYNTSF